MRMKKYIYIALLTGIIAGIVYFQFDSIQKDEFNTQIKIGAAFALSGDSSVVAWGEEARNGATLAVEELNKDVDEVNGVELVIEDMQSSSKGSISAVSKLITVDNVHGVLVSWLDVYQGAAPLAKQHNVPIITPDGGIEGVNSTQVHENVFSTWYRTDAKAEKIIKYMKSIGTKRIAIVLQNDSYYTDFLGRIDKYAEKYGMKVVSKELVNQGAIDINTQVTKVFKAKPDAIIVCLYDKKNMYSFMKLSKQNPSQIGMFGDELMRDYASDTDLKSLLEGVVYFHAALPNKDFVDRYKRKFGKEPRFGASTAYDAVKIMVQALRTKKENQSFDSYLRTGRFDTATYGKITFDQIGGVKTDNNQFDLFKVQNGLSHKIEW